MKWDVPTPGENDKGHHLGRGCQRCKDSGSDSGCNCGPAGGGSVSCSPGKECQCAKDGKCCKCCCKDKCKAGCAGENANCSCIENGKNSLGIREHKDSYRSAYEVELVYEWNIGKEYLVWPKWSDRKTSKKRALGARILLGSVCLIWSGITYMYWTGKYHKSSPRWNNHILDGSGLDDGTLSQWLQALGFPREMLNNSGPQNRLDKVIWDGLSDKLLLGFKVPSGLYTSGVHDHNDNTARKPAGMNYPGLVHTIHRDSFNKEATVFQNGSGSSTTDTNMHKYGALFKLYILSCAYFTGLQKKSTESATASTNKNTPRTIREILYWLSALPYSQAYPEILKHGKDRLREVLKKPGETESGTDNDQKQLKFFQDKRPAPITVDQYNLFAHFQAVTQYCPLVLIGIQGGIHSTKGTKEPAIHSLYANTECSFTYPTVSIQAYNQVVHYIRALFYQLYFLRKQCAVKVALGGKWRECRYGSGVLGKGVISWMCLGCDPMEHDRKSRVNELKKTLDGVIKVKPGNLPGALKEVLQKIGEVVVQLGNAQEALEGKEKKAIEGVKGALEKAKGGGLDGKLTEAKEALEKLTKNGGGILKDSYWLKEAKTALEKLTNGGSGGILKDVETKLGSAASDDFDQGKNEVSKAINGVREALEALKKGLEEYIKARTDQLSEGKMKLSHVIPVSTSLDEENALLDAIKDIISICNSPKCPPCHEHAKKCGKQSNPTICKTCLQPTTTGVPSPLQAFLEDRLPGFSCREVPDQDNPTYPPAASHLEHCGGSGQCCPLPMGFRGNFQEGITNTGHRHHRHSL